MKILQIDFDSAVELFTLARRLPYGITLDSSPGFGQRGLYSYACADPFLVLTCSKGRTEAVTRSGLRIPYDNPFAALRELLRRFQIPYEDLPTPFAVGAAGWFSYDLGRWLEKLGPGPADDTGTPDISLGFYDSVAALDHSNNKAWIYSVRFEEDEIYTLPDAECELHNRPSPPNPLSQCWEKGSRSVDAGAASERRWYDLLHSTCSSALGGASYRGAFPSPSIGRGARGEGHSSFTKDEYLRAVLQAKEYIASGDIYQVNLSQRFSTPLQTAPEALYERLAKVNPAPYSCFINFGEHIVESASPEEFLAYDAGTRRVVTSPIKGTRPRGRTPEEDAMLIRDLQTSEKDRAENVMIVDLERNDLGKVCNYGSVTVTDLYTIETHPTVHHLVSVVEGRLHERHDIVDLLKATFPGGSITGAPKLRSMEIIDELEPVRRGIYTGSAGYIDFRGNTGLNILIRSFLIHNNIAYFHAGGGIVADSDPESEYQETLHKVEGLMRSLRENG